MANYVVHEAENGLWTVVEEGSTDPVAGEEGFRTGFSKEEAERIAARMNTETSQGKSERT
jgi:hypothetical protein